MVLHVLPILDLPDEHLRTPVAPELYRVFRGVHLGAVQISGVVALEAPEAQITAERHRIHHRLDVL